ncbi:hypothetical protein EDB82DRAFT_494625 [Fusarium venenatum]|nr:hypothetical protein EDB82DRAFT_494625 [Fusarium venenatum]
MWVSDRTSAAKPKSLAKKGEKTAGITKSEFGIVSDRLVDADKLYFKSDAPDPDKIPDGEFVIEAGSHFMIVAKNSVGDTVAVLDYVFGRPNPQAGKQILVAEEKNKDPAKAPFKKSVGPLLIENIGLTYNATEKRLGVILDATFLLGPIGLALLGFGVNVKLAKDDNEEKNPEPYSHDRLTSLAVKAAGLGSLPISDPQVTLEGLMVSFDRPPVTIAGGFARTVVDEVPYYAGGLIVGFVPWKLMAMGVYGEVPKEKTKSLVKRGHRRGRSSVFDIIEMSSDDELDDIQFGKQEDKKKNSHDTFTMVFVILKVEGPLFSIGFADISGLTAGVGVNSAIRLPTAETVLDFPFTKPSGTPNPSEGPLAALKTVLRPPSKDVAPWFTAREGSFWIAAGLKVTALSVLSADAVLVITTTPSVQIGIFGVAVIDVPSLASPVKFAHAELGIACVFDPEAGTFRFDAQLSPRSYVLHESCHLSGGMALYAWAKTGDFVMTLGGYHQAFAVPAAYPRPPRLGIAWSLGDNLRISGEAYFAVTARVCMGGGKLNATLSIGPLSAWFDAFLDFLINFRPFKFAADGGIAVGVRFSLDLWLVTVRINAEIKATLSVLGPPMAGTVHVDFWVFGFDIDFGDRAKALEQGAFKLSLDQFKNLVLKGGGTAATGVPMPMDWVDVKNPIMTTDDNPASQKTSERFLFNCTAGLLPENNTNIASGSKPSESCNVSWMRTMFGDNKNISKNTWAVKAGELEFNITLAFAASAVTVKDNRNTAIDKVWTVTIPAAQQEIYALPMRLTGAIESTVEMTIDQEEEVTKPFHVIEEEKRSSKRWLVKPILKNVPMNLWGRYDAASDPALAGNAVKSLLNPATATGSVSLVMGLSFQPPLPAMSKDKVPKFNIVADMLERVNNDGYPFKEIESVASDAWKPLPRREYEGEWKRVKHEWEKDGVNERANKVVGLWSAMMNWSKEKDKVLMGTRPGGLLGRYEDMLPVPPRIASAA